MTVKTQHTNEVIIEQDKKEHTCQERLYKDLKKAEEETPQIHVL